MVPRRGRRRDGEGRRGGRRRRGGGRGGAGREEAAGPEAGVAASMAEGSGEEAPQRQHRRAGEATRAASPREGPDLGAARSVCLGKTAREIGGSTREYPPEWRADESVAPG